MDSWGRRNARGQQQTRLEEGEQRKGKFGARGRMGWGTAEDFKEQCGCGQHAVYVCAFSSRRHSKELEQRENKRMPERQLLDGASPEIST